MHLAVRSRAPACQTGASWWWGLALEMADVAKDLGQWPTHGALSLKPLREEHIQLRCLKVRIDAGVSKCPGWAGRTDSKFRHCARGFGL